MNERSAKGGKREMKTGMNERRTKRREREKMTGMNEGSAKRRNREGNEVKVNEYMKELPRVGREREK